jgi:hypothetical protein
VSKLSEAREIVKGAQQAQKFTAEMMNLRLRIRKYNSILNPEGGVKRLYIETIDNPVNRYAFDASAEENEEIMAVLRKRLDLLKAEYLAEAGEPWDAIEEEDNT